MQILGAAGVLVKAKTGQYKKDINGAERITRKFGKNAAASVGMVTASFVSLAGVAGIGGLAVATIKMGAKFESQMATVRGIMRASDADFDLLTDAAKRMGEQTEWSATQSAEALNYMGLAGWSVQKSIAGLPGMLSAATAAGMDLGETSDILTDTLTAMGLEIEDIGRLTDVMIGTTTRANTDFRQMGEAMKEAAPYAKAYGFEIEEVSALLGIVADAGIKGAAAGTGLKNAWVNNAKAAKILGTEGDDLIGTLRAANKAQWDTNQYVKAYGKIAGKTVLNIAAQIDKYEALTEKLHDVQGETKKLAEIKLDTLTGDFKILKSTIEAVGLAAYDNLKGELREGVQDLTEYVRDNKQVFVDLAEDLKNIVIDFGKLGVRVGSLFKTVVVGWTSLPSVIQDIGIVGAVIGGAKARAALLLIAAAIGKVKEFNDIAGDVSNTDILVRQLNMASVKLIGLKQDFADLKGNDLEYFGPKTQRNIKDTEQRIRELWSAIEQGKVKTIEAVNQAVTDTYDIDFGNPFDGLDDDLNTDHLTEAQRIAAETKAKLWKDDHLRQFESQQNLNQKLHSLRGNESIIALQVLKDQQAKEVENTRVSNEEKASDWKTTHEKMYADTKRMSDLSSLAIYEYGEKAVKVGEETADAWANAFDGWAVEFSSTLTDMVWGADTSFKEIAISFGKMMTQMIIQQEMMAAVSWMGGFLGSAKGNAFDGGGVMAYARGGAFTNSIVNQPTLFAHGGGFGVMGEAGPEAILPLTRTSSGDLGVKSQVPNIKIEIINNGDSVQAKEKSPQWDGEKWVIGIVLDAMQSNRGGFRNNMKGMVRA